MTLQMFDVEIDDTGLEDFVLVEYPSGSPVGCDSDTRIDIPLSDVVEVVALEEDENANSVAPLRTFWDCPPLALAGLSCALIYCSFAVLFYGFVVALILRLAGLP